MQQKKVQDELQYLNFSTCSSTFTVSLVTNKTQSSEKKRKKKDYVFSDFLPGLTSAQDNFPESRRERDLITAISRPRFVPGLWAPYLCKILRALIPGQKQSTSIRSVSTVTAHTKAKTVKSHGDVCLSAWFERGVCVDMKELDQMVIPLSQLPALLLLLLPKPTLFSSARPLSLSAASHGRVWKSEASLLY